MYAGADEPLLAHSMDAAHESQAVVSSCHQLALQRKQSTAVQCLPETQVFDTTFKSVYVLQFHGHDGLGDAPQAVPTAASVTICASEGQYSS